MGLSERFEEIRRRLADGDRQGAARLLVLARDEARAEGDAELAALLTVELAGFWTPLGRRAELQHLLEEDVALLAPEHDLGVRARVLVELAQVAGAEVPDEGLAHAAAADALAARSGDTETRLRTLATLVDLLLRGLHLQEAAITASGLIDVATQRGDRTAVAMGHLARAEALLGAGRPELALDEGRAAHDHARTGDDPALLTHAAEVHGAAARRVGRLEEAVRQLDQALTMSGEHPTTRLLLEWGLAHVAFGDQPPGVADALRAAAETGTPGEAHDAELGLAEEALARGRLDEAAALLGEEDEEPATLLERLVRGRLALARGEIGTTVVLAEALVRARPRWVGARLLFADALWAGGGVAEALEVLDAFLEEADGRSESAALHGCLRRAAFALAIGDVTEAHRHATRAAELAAEVGAGEARTSARLLLARTLLADGSLPEAHAQARAAFDEAERDGLRAGMAAATLVLARTFAADGDLEAAFEQLEAARQQADGSGDIRLQVLARLHLAAALAGRGEVLVAASLSDEARELDARYGTGLAATIALAERRIGITTSPA